MFHKIMVLLPSTFPKHFLLFFGCVWGEHQEQIAYTWGVTYTWGRSNACRQNVAYSSAVVVPTTEEAS